MDLGWNEGQYEPAEIFNEHHVQRVGSLVGWLLEANGRVHLTKTHQDKWIHVMGSVVGQEAGVQSFNPSCTPLYLGALVK